MKTIKASITDVSDVTMSVKLKTLQKPGIPNFKDSRILPQYTEVSAGSIWGHQSELCKKIKSSVKSTP